MRVAPFRALPQETVRTWATAIFVEMRVAPFRALPPIIKFNLTVLQDVVEMRVAPFRALPQGC